MESSEIIPITISHNGQVSILEDGKIKIQMDGRETIQIELPNRTKIRYRFHDLIRLLELIEAGAIR